MATFNSCAKLYKESLIRFTAVALSNQAFTFCGFAFICDSKSP